MRTADQTKFKLTSSQKIGMRISSIDRLPKGFVFTYEDFIGDVNKKEAIIKAVNRKDLLEGDDKVIVNKMEKYVNQLSLL